MRLEQPPGIVFLLLDVNMKPTNEERLLWHFNLHNNLAAADKLYIKKGVHDTHKCVSTVFPFTFLLGVKASI